VEEAMNWIQTGTALTALVGAVYVGTITLATKEEVKTTEGRVINKVMETEDRVLGEVEEAKDEVYVVQKKVDQHVISDEIFYTNRRIWDIKKGKSDCNQVTQQEARNECKRLELKVKNLEEEKKALMQ
jgi:hypothetical protein